MNNSFYHFLKTLRVNVVILKPDRTIVKILNRSPESRRVDCIIPYLNKINTNEDIYILCDPDNIETEIRDTSQFKSFTNNNTFLIMDIVNPELYGKQCELVPDHYLLDPLFFDRIIPEILKKHITFSDKLPICFFRGAYTGHRILDNDILMNKRIKCAINFKNNANFDIGLTECDNFPKDELKTKYNIDLVSRVHPSEYCKYKYCLSIDGYVSAWRRPVEIMYAGSVLLMQHSFKQYFYDRLINGYNYIRINDDLSNLDETIKFLIKNEAVAKQIAKNGHDLALDIFNRKAIEKSFCVPPCAKVVRIPSFSFALSGSPIFTSSAISTKSLTRLLALWRWRV